MVLYWTELEGFLLESCEAWHLERGFEETCVSPPCSTKALLYAFESSKNEVFLHLGFLFFYRGIVVANARASQQAFELLEQGWEL